MSVVPVSKRPAAVAPSLAIRLGQSLALDLHHCQRSVLADLGRVREILVGSARESGATVIDAHFHEFSPQGISGVVVITESHFAIHTWPEYGFAAVDIFTCGSSVDFDRAIQVLEEGFQASVVSINHRLERGTMPDPKSRGLERTSDPPPASVSSWKEKFERERAGNLFALIEIDGCKDPVSGVQSFLTSSREFLGIGPEAEAVVRGSEDDSTVVFLLTGANATVSGRIVRSTSCAYISIMSGMFFEPAILARTAVRHLSGAAYGLHVGINP